MTEPELLDLLAAHGEPFDASTITAWVQTGDKDLLDAMAFLAPRVGKGTGRFRHPELVAGFMETAAINFAAAFAVACARAANSQACSAAIINHSRQT
jgi:hypothetical protein